MIEFPDPSRLSLQAVAEECSQQIEPACFELFRRAIADGEERAWAHIHTQYHRLVGYWVRQHPRLVLCEEDVDHFVNAAFARMARSITPAKFGDYQHVGQLVKFLKLCAFCAVQDHLRQQPEPTAMLGATLAAPPDPATADELDVWRRCIEPRVKGEQERLVAYGSFVLNVKPRDFPDAWPGRFKGMAEVYQIKANLLERLRRDEGLRRCLEDA